MRQTPSPLRYPGGKIRLANFVKYMLVQNDLVGGTYVEAYAGGAGIAWRLLFDNFVHDVYINDINRSVHSFWHSVFNHTEELCRLIQDTPITMDEWHRQKARQSAQDVGILDLGFSTFFLNRTNHSGILQGGVIGGKNQAGNYKLDARYNQIDLIVKIQKIASYQDRVRLYRQDALEFINNVIPTLPLRTLIYLDPPYYQKGAALYESHYSHDDHVAVATALQNIAHKWIVSYDNTPKIREIYAHYRNNVYELPYNAAERYNGQEIIFFSGDLNIYTDNPLLIKQPKLIHQVAEQLVFYE